MPAESYLTHEFDPSELDDLNFDYLDAIQ
jgi:hypothetical protein